jgi:hypothetical protein
MNLVKKDLLAVTSTLKRLVEEENQLVYIELYGTYNDALLQYEKSGDLHELVKNINNTTRMVLESPTNNEALGLELLENITTLYNTIGKYQ